MNENLERKKFDDIVFWGSVIDILFIPYAFFMAISYSIFLLIPWLIIHFQELRKRKEFKLFIIFSILTLLSAAFGSFLRPYDLGNNVSRAIQIIQILGYYFMFADYLERYSVKLKPFLFTFTLFVMIFAILYNINRTLYSSLIILWNPRGFSGMMSLYGSVDGRFAFLWMDPNNIAYTYVGIIGFLLTNEKSNTFEKFIYMIGLMLVLFSAMSSGGFISFAVLFVLIFLTYIIRRKIRVTKNALIKIIASPIVVFILYLIYQSYSQSSVARAALLRIENNSMDSRSLIWESILKGVSFWKYIIIGKGGTTYLDNGIPIKPHNGHFYVILACGIIAYAIFMYIVFRKRKITPFRNYVWISAILLGFTANVLLGEVKLFAIVMLLVACSSSKRYLSERGYIYE